MNVAEAARELGYSPWYVRKLARKGDALAGTREGRDWNFPKDAVMAFKQARRQKGANPIMKTLLKRGIFQS